LKSIDEEIKQIKEAGVKVCDEQYSVKVLHVYDLSAFWKVCVGCKFGCPYCKLTREDEGWFVPPERDKKHWERELPTEALFCHSVEDFIICILHMKMRMVDLIMELLLERLNVEEGWKPLEKRMSELNLPFSVHVPDSGPNQGKERVKGFDGKEAHKVLKKLKKILQVWPPYMKATYAELTDEELRKEATKYNIPTTKQSCKQKLRTKEELVQELRRRTTFGVTHLRKFNAEKVRALAEEYGILTTTTIYGQEEPRTREDIEADLKEGERGLILEGKQESRTDIAIRLWTKICKLIKALECGKGSATCKLGYPLGPTFNNCLPWQTRICR
jgi:hypothetical protein